MVLLPPACSLQIPGDQHLPNFLNFYPVEPVKPCTSHFHFVLLPLFSSLLSSRW